MAIDDGKGIWMEPNPPIKSMVLCTILTPCASPFRPSPPPLPPYQVDFDFVKKRKLLRTIVIFKMNGFVTQYVEQKKCEVCF